MDWERIGFSALSVAIGYLMCEFQWRLRLRAFRRFLNSRRDMLALSILDKATKSKALT